MHKVRMPLLKSSGEYFCWNIVVRSLHSVGWITGSANLMHLALILEESRALLLFRLLVALMISFGVTVLGSLLMTCRSLSTWAPCLFTFGVGVVRLLKWTAQDSRMSSMSVSRTSSTFRVWLSLCVFDLCFATSLKNKSSLFGVLVSGVSVQLASVDRNLRAKEAT